MSSFQRATTFIVPDKMHSGGDNFKSCCIKSKIPQPLVPTRSQPHLMFHVRKVRPSSRLQPENATRRSASSTSVVSSSRPPAYLIRPGYKSYSEKLKKTSQDMRMKKIEESLVRIGSQLDLSINSIGKETDSSRAWKAFIIIGLLFVMAFFLILNFEVDMSSHLLRKFPVMNIFKDLQKQEAQKKLENLPLVHVFWIKLRDFAYSIRK